EFVLDEMTDLNQSDPGERFTDRIDLDMVGVFGHSTGGAAAVEFCWQDLRCKVVLGMDTWMAPISDQVIEESISQPIVLMHSQDWDTLFNPSGHYARADKLLKGLDQPGVQFTIEGTKHLDFSSLPLLSPLMVNLGLKGPIDGDRVLEIINTYTLDFFNHYLKSGKLSYLTKAQADYPEVIYGEHP
ncbi:MAG: hypothetical protein N2D54_09185, partial [Chloroflexota bacterium]